MAWQNCAHISRTSAMGNCPRARAYADRSLPSNSSITSHGVAEASSMPAAITCTTWSEADLRSDPRFLHKALSQLVVADEMLVHDLERARASGADLFDQVHGAHAALAQGSDDPEVQTQRQCPDGEPAREPRYNAITGVGNAE